MRRVIIAGNWKMYKTPAEGAAMVRELLPLATNPRCEVVIFPPYVTYASVSEAAAGSVVQVGVQNMHWEKEGAYTGEISPTMLKAIGCKWVIIGHSERRQYFAETDETVNKKIRSALDNDITPVMCVGESLAIREEGKAKGFVGGQVKNALQGFTPGEVEKIVIAYEPIWAIGTGKTASKEDAQEMCRHIRLCLATEFGEETAQKVSILYGGSVKPENIKDLMGQPDIDGALVGGASLTAQSFAQIINF